MENFKDWLAESNVQLVLGILGAIGWLVGIVSGWLQWKSYQEQKKIEGGYRNILEQAQRDWQGRYTEEQIKELTAQFKRLEEQIRSEIPKQARRVFLEDRKNTLATSITELYQQYSTANDEIKTSSSVEALAPNLQEAIEQQIMPAYLERQRQQRILYFLVIIILILNVFPFITEFAFSFIFGFRIPIISQFIPTDDLLAYLTGLGVSTFLAFSIPVPQSRRVVMKHARIFKILGASLLVIWASIVYLVVFEPINVYRNMEVLGAVISLLPFSLGIRILNLVFGRTS